MRVKKGVGVLWLKMGGSEFRNGSWALRSKNRGLMLKIVGLRSKWGCSDIKKGGGSEGQKFRVLSQKWGY